MTENYTLDEMKIHAKLEVDLGAGTVRGRAITSVRGQAETYMAKETEARACVTDSSPVAGNYPMLAAEVGITGDDLMAVAAAIVIKANEWKAFGGAIEAVRLGTKQAIDAAVTEAELDVIVTNVIWPSS